MDEEICDDPGGRSFVGLVSGKVKSLNIAIAIGATSCKRTEPSVGIWTMTREQFLVIADSIRKQRLGMTNTSDLDVANLCDGTGIENRFFRLDPAVSDWMDNNEPQPVNLDYVIL